MLLKPMPELPSLLLLLAVALASGHVPARLRGGLPRLEAAEPLYWLHFAKCGSSFINSLIHLPGVCPLASSLVVDEQSLGTCFMEKWYSNLCPEVCDAKKFFCPHFSEAFPHQPIDSYMARKGKLEGMFRNPEQRILSAYHDDADNFAAVSYEDHVQDMLAMYANGSLDMSVCSQPVPGLPKVPVLEFAESWKGGMTYQLVVDFNLHPTQTLDPDRPKMTREDAEEAARRVREGFSSVGITEEWALSICLLHKMFGGACQESDFDDLRPSSTAKSGNVDYDVSELMGWYDDVDSVVYDAASDVFHRNLITFDVSHESCRECYGHAQTA